jgi:type III restriction enzyme
MFPLKPFQEKAVAELKNQFLSLWKTSGTQIPLVLKSPTGSGKTVMLAQFLRDLVSDPRFQGNDVGFIWMSKGPTLVEQSKNKLFQYYSGASELDLLDINDLNRKVLPKNSVFFVNWEKLKGQSKDVLKIRRENEQDISFDRMIEATHEEKRKIVVIIDEEHLGADTNRALELIDGLIKPKIIIRVSATPKLDPSHSEVVNHKAGIVEVPREDVIREGLIKEKIIFQTKEDLQQTEFKGMDQDQVLLELAYQKREELLSYYKKLGIDINPLVLIQLPNDDQATSETTSNSKKDLVLNFLKQKKVKDPDVAVWLTGKEKINLENIESNTSAVSFLIFKLAVATGWDCPRAGVLVMFREIGHPSFLIQTVGRILRMPSGMHYGKPELNIGYLYTNYTRNEVATEESLKTSGNLPAIYPSHRKKNVGAIEIESVLMSRSDYNDLGDTFQETFKKVANKYFGIKDGDKDIKKKFANKDLEVSPSLTNGLIVGVEIDDYDNFTKELMAGGDSYDEEMSQHDIELSYNLMCFKIIAKQSDENKKFAPERSWGKLKTALNVWYLNAVDGGRLNAYKSILRDLLKEGSVLRSIIGDALEQYRPIRDQEVNKKSARARRVETIEIPRPSLFYTENYEVMKVKKSAMEPFYIEKAPFENEASFIKFLEEQDVSWWYKNGNSGSEYFSISYNNPDENKEKLFYPDWIVRIGNTTWIIDTKAGMTAESNDTKYKAEALQEWFKNKKGFKGGIAVKDVNGWKINSDKKYSYSPSFKGWQPLII